MLGKGLTADDDFVNFDVLGFFKVAKASRTPSDVCKLMEKTGLRLLRKGRAEAGK